MRPRLPQHARRGGVVIYVSVSLAVLLGMTAMAVDLGILRIARAELQTTSDGSALAGAVVLLNDERLKSPEALNTVIGRTRSAVADVVGRNPVLNLPMTVDLNSGNAPNGDIVIGYLADPSDPNCPLRFDNPALFNSVQVRVRKDAERNGVIATGFARIFGIQSMTSGARATATFQDGVVGYRVTEKTGNAGLLPLALHRDIWNDLMNGLITTDNFTYDPATGAVSAGPDGVNEINLFPGNGNGQMPPGNFGTVDIGSPNNSTADISRQIREGVNAADLAYFDGELKLDENGTLLLNGDTGLSAAIKDDLVSIKGQPRSIPIFSEVHGPGNNAYFTIVGFVGVRIMDVRLTGAMNSKRVIIQPAIVIDDSTISRPGATQSYFVYRPVGLTR